MIQILTLLKQGVLATLLDLDNAVYMLSKVDNLQFQKQKQAIIWGVTTEFIARIALISFLGSLLSENKVLFTLLGFKFTLNSLVLFIAGSFLIYSSTRELYQLLNDREKIQKLQPPPINFLRLIFEITIVNLLLSIDTIIVVLARVSELSSIIFIFLISAIIRLLTIDRIAYFIKKYSSMNIVILVFLILIGFELFLEAIWFKFPEEIFNAAMILAIIGAIFYQRQQA